MDDTRQTSPIVLVDQAEWQQPAGRRAGDWTDELEAGAVLVLPRLGFEVTSAEQLLYSPSVAAAKNVSFDPATGRVGGAREDADRTRLGGLLRRFSGAAAALAEALFPHYAGRLERARASFRPAEIAGRATSWRHDDTRLHIDSFPATPSGGRRILRVFTNVNPAGRPRTWRIGERFEEAAARFAPRLRMPLPMSAPLLRLVRITKSRRSKYDALMLQLHDAMKRDAEYQRCAPQQAVEFAPGTTWVAFTDQVSHAAMSGQYQLEQTFLVPVAAMRRPDGAPLRVLERLKGRSLA